MPLDSKKKSKNQEKEGKINEKGENGEQKGKNQGGSFTLPLMTDRAGYATDQSNWFDAWNIHFEACYDTKYWLKPTSIIQQESLWKLLVLIIICT